MRFVDPRVAVFLRRAMWALELTLWLGALVALVSWTRGNPTAINAVIGVGFWAVTVTGLDVLAWLTFRTREDHP